MNWTQDADKCTTETCNSATGAVTSAPNWSQDADKCTTETCNPATGLVSSAANWTQDANKCDVESCVPATGLLVHTPNWSQDADKCTTESCEPTTGQVTSTVNWSQDSNKCTTETCDSATGQVSSAVNWSQDADKCTTETCDTATGQVSSAVNWTQDANLCDTESCDPATGNLSHAAVDQDDHNACTADSCVAETGVAHVAIPVVDDNDPCTVDACDPAIGMTHTPFECVPTTFAGFSGIDAGVRAEVSMSATLNANYPATNLVIWKLHLTRAGVDAEGVVAYYPTAGEEANAHTTWTAFIETNADGEATFGPAGGFPASVVKAGAQTSFSVVFDNDGTYNLVVELFDVTRNVSIGSEGIEFVVDGVTASFGGFTGITAGTAHDVTFSGALPSDYPATLVLWRSVLTTAAGAPVAGIVGKYPDAGDDPLDKATWSTVTTDGDGEVWFGPAGGFPSAVLSSATRTTPFEVTMPTAGSYVQTLELWDTVKNVRISTDSVAFTVGAPN